MTRPAPIPFGMALLGLTLAGLARGAEPATEKAAYIGVATSIASPALREQLGLPRGVGVVIDAVDSNSPADKAGLIVHDIVTRFDDQVIINVHQFGVLVRLRKPGETVKLAVVRRGKPIDVTLELGGRTVSAMEDQSTFSAAGGPRNGRLSSIVTQTDGAHVITLTQHGDADRHVRIADTTGVVIFEGPLNTADDHDRLPADCRAKVETMEKNWDKFNKLRNASPSPRTMPAPAAAGAG